MEDIVVGAVVERRRRSLGLTQVELGRRTGLSQNYISKLEKGLVDLPQRGTLEALSGALGVPIGDFYQAAGVLPTSAELAASEDRAAPPELPEPLMDALRQMIRDHPELAAQFAAAAEDDDFPAQVRELALALGYVVKGWLGGD